MRIACDDFGTGYSSLVTLRDLPFSTLKIDRSFVGAEENDARAAVILENVVNLAHDLGMDVVAEGVETEEQMARLTVLGCDMAQGWLIGQPVSARRVIEALTGMSLDVGRPRSCFAAFRERLFGSGGKTEEDGRLVLPVPPVPSAPSASSKETEEGGEAEVTEEPAEKPEETESVVPEEVEESARPEERDAGEPKERETASHGNASDADVPSDTDEDGAEGNGGAEDETPPPAVIAGEGAASDAEKRSGTGGR